VLLAINYPLYMLIARSFRRGVPLSPEKLESPFTASYAVSLICEKIRVPVGIGPPYVNRASAASARSITCQG